MNIFFRGPAALSASRRVVLFFLLLFPLSAAGDQTDSGLGLSLSDIPLAPMVSEEQYERVRRNLAEAEAKNRELVRENQRLRVAASGEARLPRKSENLAPAERPVVTTLPVPVPVQVQERTRVSPPQTGRASDRASDRANSRASVVEPRTGMEFVFVPGGCFQMGADPAEPGRDHDERQHEVCLDAFWMSKYEVTNRQYRLFAPRHHVGDDERPVTDVSWEEAVDYLAWLNAGGGWEFGLPTEAQWEYAARGGGENIKFPRGDEPPVCARGTVNGATFDDRGVCGGLLGPGPVGLFAANGLGLHDMAGNVWEWCADWYETENYSAGVRHNPRGPQSGETRVARGGGWASPVRHLRVANRGKYPPAGRSFNLGFRPVAPEAMFR